MMQAVRRIAAQTAHVTTNNTTRQMFGIPKVSSSLAWWATRNFRAAPAASASIALQQRTHPAAAHAHANNYTQAQTCRCCSGGSGHKLTRSTNSSTAVPSRSFSTIEALPPQSTTVTAEVTQIATDPNARFIALYTCKVCETRAAKSISRQAYTHGVVLVRCDGCQKLHLFADNLGWFDDTRLNIEDIMREKGMEVSHDPLHLTQEQLSSIAQLQQQLAEKAAKTAAIKKANEQQHQQAAAAQQAQKTKDAVLEKR